jgi:hypothetical protein
MNQRKDTLIDLTEENPPPPKDIVDLTLSSPIRKSSFHHYNYDNNFDDDYNKENDRFEHFRRKYIDHNPNSIRPALSRDVTQFQQFEDVMNGYNALMSHSCIYSPIRIANNRLFLQDYESLRQQKQQQQVEIHHVADVLSKLYVLIFIHSFFTGNLL